MQLPCNCRDSDLSWIPAARKAEEAILRLVLALARSVLRTRSWQELCRRIFGDDVVDSLEIS